MNRVAWSLVATSLGLCCCPGLAAEPITPEAARFFESKIRPLLVARCYECHGPDSAADGNLRLDTRAGMLRGGDRGPALKPGEPQQSLLIDAVKHGDVVQMPPKSRLPAAEIADLTNWVAQGAPWPGATEQATATPAQAPSAEPTEEDRKFWAFQPPQEPAIPVVRDTNWPRSPIDRLVLAPLEARGLKPAGETDKRTLIRRATLDLHGLPPDPADVERFLADESPEAFARVVDRLLASPRYGERWGRHWLDIARYADSNGMDENMAMAHAWRYRDYVIEAFNRDMPYDQFLREQLAGDLLPAADDATRFRQLTATGYLVLGPKMLAEDDPVKMEMDIIDEQVDTLGRAVMGLTLGCARCHDHKFDPISTSDYYALAGIFKSTKSMENYRVVAMWSERPLASDADQARLADNDAKSAKIAAEIKQLSERANEAMLSEARGRLGDYLLAATRRGEEQTARAELEKQWAAGQFAAETVTIEAESFSRGNLARDTANYGAGIGVVLNAGPIPNYAEYDFELPAAGTYLLAVRYAAAEPRGVEASLDHRRLDQRVADKATGSWQPDAQAWSIVGVYPLATGRHTIRLERDGPFPHLDKLALVPAAGSIASNAETSLNAAILDQWVEYLAKVQDDAHSIWRIWLDWQNDPSENKRLNALPGADTILRQPRPTTRRELAQRYEERFRRAGGLAGNSADGATPQFTDPGDEAFRQVGRDSRGPFALPKRPEVYYPAPTRAELAKLKDQAEALKQARPKLDYALAVADREPQDLRVHLRGSHLTLGSLAPRRFPRVLTRDGDATIAAKASGRLQLAEWLSRPDHPLTARVMVNRIWQGHFGEGLVRSPDNFGKLGEKCDNQPLLDWLALRFVESGWSIKAMHRRIMLSSAYRMSTADDPSMAEIDPENRLLRRMNRRRMAAEEIRDAILATTGDVDWAMGGTLLTSSNHTYVTSTASVNNVSYENQRRSVYLPIVRSAVYDVLQAFDFADPSTINGRRPATTVAPQALFMMNSPLMLRQTRALARQLVARTDLDDAGRIELIYQRAYSRPPNAGEQERLLRFLAEYPATIANSAGEKKLDEAEIRLRAWQALARVILSSNEFVYVE